jgi:hypothetical protein
MRRSVSRGNVRPVRVGAARPRDGEAGRWSKAAAKSIETGIPTPTKPIFPASERSLRAGRWLSGPEVSENRRWTTSSQTGNVRLAAPAA